MKLQKEQNINSKLRQEDVSIKKEIIRESEVRKKKNETILAVSKENNLNTVNVKAEKLSMARKVSVVSANPPRTESPPLQAPVRTESPPLQATERSAKRTSHEDEGICSLSSDPSEPLQEPSKKVKVIICLNLILNKLHSYCVFHLPGSWTMNR